MNFSHNGDDATRAPDSEDTGGSATRFSRRSLLRRGARLWLSAWALRALPLGGLLGCYAGGASTARVKEDAASDQGSAVPARPKDRETSHAASERSASSETASDDSKAKGAASAASPKRKPRPENGRDATADASLGDDAGGVLAQHPWMRPWVREDHMDPAWLQSLFGKIRPYRVGVRLMDRQAEAKPYHQYRTQFLSRRVITAGRRRMRRDSRLLQQVEQTYGPPPEVIVALWGIESRFGNNTGRHPVLRSLYTLSVEYPRRASFFRQELREYLLLCQEEGWDAGAMTGSFAGALGQVQMIPSTLRRFAVDFDKDGRRDVLHTRADVLASIGHFLQGHGWRRGGSYALPIVGGPPLDPWVVESLEDMRPWGAWRADGIRLPAYLPQPQRDEPAAIIRLEERDGPRYHMVFHNFRVVTRWNRSRRFAMVVGELASQLLQTA